VETGGHVVGLVGAVAGLLLVAAGTQALSKRTRFPFTVALVLVGIVLDQAARGGPEWMAPILEFELPPGVVFFVFLPALVFESSFNMEARALKENLSPVLTLAVPGLLISTGLVAAAMHLAVGMEWPMALLLGSILSATDPVGVVALFQQLGAPKRLTVLVEGESLFNDATAIVLSKVVLGLMLAGTLTTAVILEGALEFLVVFFGGLAVGWACAAVVGLVLGRVEADAFIEISLTLVLAYFAFILAEDVLATSGVMATAISGIMIGGWGKRKISPELAEHLEHFWDYLAGVANALVFLMVGLRVDLGALLGSLDLLLLAILAMLGSRALVIYGVIPIVGRLPGTDPIDRRYQTVMFWGGLRGAIALAIALSLPPFEGRETIVALTMGAVLFTLLVPGLTMEGLVSALGLDVPPLSDRLARTEGLLSAKRRTLGQIPELREGGLFSPRIAETIGERCREDIRRMRRELEELRERELDVEEERKLVFLRCFAEEKSLYYTMFSRGHLSEWAFRDLSHSIELQTEAIRHEGRLPEYTLHPPTGERLETILHRVLEQLPGTGGAVESLRAERTARDYEVAWARSRASRKVLGELDDLGAEESARSDIVEEIRAFYEYWHANARSRMDQTAEQFPEFVASTQERLAERLVLHAEREAIEEKAHAGTIPEGVAESMLDEMAQDIRELRASQRSKLRVDPRELLRKVPFFEETPEEEFARVAERLRPRTAPAGDVIIRQGETGDSLYLVARGVIRVSTEDGGRKVDLATLMAGDFFGEMALLRGEPRTATCRAVTPCALYELRRSDLDAVRSACPAIQEALEEADRERRADLATRTAEAGRSEP